MSSNNQPRITLFLGAGASVTFGKPTTKGLRKKLFKEYEKLEAEIRSKYGGKPENPRNEELWHSILLQSILNFKESDDIEHVEFEDIEHVLQALKETYDFFVNGQYGGRYVKSLIKRKYADEYTPATNLDWKFTEYVKTIPKLKERIENKVFDNYRWDNNSDDEPSAKIYHPLFAEIMKHSNSNDIRIFTTNYDRAIEEYCSSDKGNYQFIDGFLYDNRSGKRKWNEGKYEAHSDKKEVPVYLYKLHGSLDWKRHKQYGIVATGVEAPVSDPNYIEQILVYPTLSPKDGQEVEPYKTIREKFKEELMKRTDVCIVIGFSIRDEHIKNIFSDFLKRRRRKTLIVVSPSAEENTREYLLKKKLPQARWKSSEMGKDIHLNGENGTEIILINDGIDADNVGNIIERIFSLSSQTRQRVPQSQEDHEGKRE